jgi:hypothetical protein
MKKIILTLTILFTAQSYACVTTVTLNNNNEIILAVNGDLSLCKVLTEKETKTLISNFCNKSENVNNDTIKKACDNVTKFNIS